MAGRPEGQCRSRPSHILTFPPSEFSVSYQSVTSSFVLSHPAWLGDSGRGRMIVRAGSAEAVVGRIRARAVVTAQSRVAPGDRTLLRFLAASVIVALSRLLRAAGETLSSACPERAWSIPRPASAPIPVSIRRVAMLRRNVQPLPCRPAAPESPGATARSVHDETRDPYQCDPAGNAGRHPRGRPAR